MIRLALVVFALSLLWPSPPVAGPVARASGTLTADYDESGGGARLTGGFELTRLPATAGLDRSGSFGRSLRRAALIPAALPARVAPALPAGPGDLTLRGAHPFFDATAPPLT